MESGIAMKAQQYAADLLSYAHSQQYTPNDAGDFILELANRILAERKQAILIPYAERYIAHESGRTLAAELGMDGKTLAAQLRPLVESLGGIWRGQRDSQGVRREMERVNGNGKRPGELTRDEAVKLSDQTLRKR